MRTPEETAGEQFLNKQDKFCSKTMSICQKLLIVANGASVSGATLEQLAPEAISPLTIRLHYTGNNGGLSISYMYTISYIKSFIG